MTLTEGTTTLANRRQSEQAEVRRALEGAEKLLRDHASGILEHQLIVLVKTELGIRLPLAAAAVDHLEAAGLADKNWASGLVLPCAR